MRHFTAKKELFKQSGQLHEKYYAGGPAPQKATYCFCGLAVVNTTYFDNGGEIYGTKGKYVAGDY